MKIYVSFPNNVNIAHFNSKVRFKILVLHIIERLNINSNFNSSSREINHIFLIDF